MILLICNGRIKSAKHDDCEVDGFWSDYTISAMAMQSNYSVENLAFYSGHGIEIIRVTAHDYDIDKGVEFAAKVKEKGYKVSINRYAKIQEGNAMSVIAVVPMKLNNRRLPRKNTKSFTNGKPLCQYILETLLTVKGIDGVYVYCSSPEIQEFLLKGVRFLKRPASLDQDSTQMNEVLHCFARDVPADVYVMTHATAPFISAASIEKGLEAVLSKDYDSAFAVKRTQEFLWKDGKAFNYKLDAIPRTQDLPLMYEETSGFYIYRSEVMTEMNRRIGDKPFLVEIGGIESVDIDEAEDFLIADAIYNHIILGGRL